MAHLIVRLRGKTIYNMPLEEGRSYVAGRKEDCDIVLQPEKGISREHFKISYNGQWMLDVVSRYGEVIQNGEQVQQIALDHGSAFTVPPYEFDFLMSSPAAQPSSSSPEYDPANLPVVTSAGSHDDSDSGDRTVVGAAPSSAFIKFVDSNNEAKELIRLDAGESWIAGRDPSCHIQIRDQRVSRRQFEIRRAGSQYVILDLGSVNGTLVNGTPISSSEPTQVKSGDAITVLDNYLYFELHDSTFQNRLDMVAVAPVNPLIQTNDQLLPAEYQHQGYDIAPYQGGGGMAPMPYQPQYQQAPAAAPMPTGKFDFKKHRPKLIAGAVAMVLIAYLFSGGEKKAPVPAQGIVAPGSPLEMFNKLKPEQQALVRQRYKDAKNMYMQGKYQLAQDEIVKIQDLVPDYEDIKEIQRLAKEAMFIQEEQRRNDEREKAKQEAEEKIQKQVVECQKKINPAITMEVMEECLSNVMQFNPEHPKIMELKSQVEILTAQREQKAADKAAYQVQVSRLKAIYSKAQDMHKKGVNPLGIIDAYEKVMAAKLPDPAGLKAQSQRNIASIRQQMNSKTASLQAEAEKYYQSQNLKGAILTLRKARQIDPENDVLPDKISRWTSELRKQMMSLYQEGILEESFGNVEGGEAKAGAKDKWKKILDLDIPDGEYYKKAYIKLKKYGAI
ncbi:MAG: FHA domain-containing protein [Bdellovibrio sp.]|nr:FHA domain-containing protein [Bdellovibrio sp.]